MRTKIYRFTWLRLLRTKLNKAQSNCPSTICFPVFSIKGPDLPSPYHVPPIQKWMIIIYQNPNIPCASHASSFLSLSLSLLPCRRIPQLKARMKALQPQPINTKLATCLLRTKVIVGPTTSSLLPMQTSIAWAKHCLGQKVPHKSIKRCLPTDKCILNERRGGMES